MNPMPNIVKEIIWNDEIENLLKNKQIECVKYSILHNIDSEKYYNFYNYIFMINAFLTSLSGCSVIMSNALFNNLEQETSSLINISFGVLLIFSTGLSSFQHMTNYAEKSRNHKEASAKFTSLGNNMLKLLALDKATKETSIENFTWCDAEFTNLQIISPNPSNHAYKCYKKDNPPELFEIKIVEVNKEVESNNQIKINAKETIQDFNKKRFANNMYM